MTESTIEVVERPGTKAGVFDVTVRDDSGSSRHLVRLDRWAEAAISDHRCSAAAFVESAFRFLLDREAKESIMPEFDLSIIARYFPEVDREIGNYLG